MNLSPNFTAEEFTRSTYATRHGIDNALPDDLLESARMQAQGLERVRAVLSLPLHVDSGYRCLAVNRGIGSSDTSRHVVAGATDIICPAFGTAKMLAQKIIDYGKVILFDRLIFEVDWVHVEFSTESRLMIMTARFEPSGTTYTMGLT